MFGHLCRLQCGSPAKSALLESLKTCNPPQGHPKNMWIKIIKDQLKDCNIQDIKTGYNIAQDRDKFRHLTSNRLKVDSTSERRR